MCSGVRLSSIILKATIAIVVLAGATLIPNVAQAQGRGGGPPGALELEISGSDLDCGQPLPGGGSTLCFGARLVVLVKDASTGQAVEGLPASAFSVRQPFTQQDCSQDPFPPVGFPLPGTLHLEDRPFATGVPLEVGEGLYTVDVTPAAGCFAPGFSIPTVQIIVTAGSREGRTLTGAFVQGPMAPF